MHDYLATDGDSSIRPDEEADARRQFYSGYRDKNKARLSSIEKMVGCTDSLRNCSNYPTQAARHR